MKDVIFDEIFPRNVCICVKCCKAALSNVYSLCV